ncbi:hypothetical protein BDR26DRAFT_931292 [Obelidium mucronatum]|nr:hypothetical protein BDR26DRAFT_931292 [Obelidium mucronatum]
MCDILGVDKWFLTHDSNIIKTAFRKTMTAENQFDAFFSWLNETPGRVKNEDASIFNMTLVGDNNEVYELKFVSQLLEKYQDASENGQSTLILVKGTVLNKMKPGSFLTDGEISALRNSPTFSILDDEVIKKKGTAHLIDLAHCMLLLFNPTGNRVYANRRAYEVWGLTEEDWRQQTTPDLRSYERLKAMKTLTRVTIEVRLIRGPLGFMSCGIDISEQKRKEAESLQAVKDLAEVQRLRAEDAEEARKVQEGFIDTVCHEIRNPLNGIMHCNDFIRSSLESIKHNISHLEKTDKSVPYLKAIEV